MGQNKKIKTYAKKEDFVNPKDYDIYIENLRAWRSGEGKRNSWKKSK